MASRVGHMTGCDVFDLALNWRPGSLRHSSRGRAFERSRSSVNGTSRYPRYGCFRNICSSGQEFEDGTRHGFDADCHRVFVDVETRVVVAPGQAALFISASDEVETAWNAVEKLAHVLGDDHQGSVDSFVETNHFASGGFDDLGHGG